MINERKLLARIAVSVVVAVLVFPQLCLGAEESMGAWLIKDLARAPAQEVKLRNKRERVLGTINVRQMVHLYAVITALVEAAEVDAEFYVVNGKRPNAFAAPAGVNEEIETNMIGISFGMLDLIGTDMHGAAAIIGHEMAHLKLNHGEESKEKQQRNTNSSAFSASATRYSRDNERDADYLGMIWTVEAGYDPAGAVRIHEALYKLPKGGFGGSHPSSIERITVLKSMVRRLTR